MRILPCLLLVLLAAGAAAEETGGDDLWQALGAGRAIALMRHAYAPGVGDPESFRLEDCGTQRNLSAEGEADARRTGARFRANGIVDADVHSSQWCRCLRTGELLGLGPVMPLPALNSFFGDRPRGPAQTAEIRRFLAGRQGTKPLVLVTHQVNITALTGIGPRSGEIVVIASGADGALEVLGRLPPPR